MRSYAVPQPVGNQKQRCAATLPIRAHKNESRRKGVFMRAESRNGRLLRDVNVAELLSVSRGYIWKLVKSGKLPPPIKLSAKLSIWKLSDVQKYLDNPELLARSE